MNHLILGPGAIGRRLAGELASAADSTHFADRRGGVEQSYDYVTASGRQRFSFLRPKASTQFDFVHICVKASQVKDALRQVQPAKSSLVLVYANGYYDREIEEFDLQPVKVATTMAARNEPKHCLRTDTRGRVYVPAFEFQRHPQLKRLVKLYPDCYERAPDYYRAVKWIINCTLNTICAAKRLPRNGDVFVAHKTLMERCFVEAAALAKMIFPERGFAREEVYRALHDTLASTADNKNSMVVDLERGRPVELDYLSGLAGPEFPNLFQLSQEIRNLR